jgi:hypothetical protein
MTLTRQKGSTAAPDFRLSVLVAGIEKKTPPVERRGFQSRPGLEGRHHSSPFNAPSGHWFLGIAGFPAEIGDADKTKEGQNIDERFDPLHAAIMQSVGAWFPGLLGQGPRKQY